MPHPFACFLAKRGTARSPQARIHTVRDLDAHQFLLIWWNPCLSGRGEHVHLAAHAEFGKVNAGLDRKTGVRQNAAHIVGFQVVQVRARSVQLLRDVVSGAMRKELAEAAVRITERAASSASKPRIPRPVANADSTAAIAASRALRTVSKTSCSLSVGSRPITPVQVMS